MDTLVDLSSLGFDSFLACLIVGALGISRRQALGLAGAFGACDAAASLLGSMWPIHLSPLMPVAAMGLCALVLAAAARGARTLLPALPLLLSLDNLCAELPSGMALPAGAASAAMAALGLYVASTVRSLLPAPRPGP
jgi:hypothetical protein